MEQMQSFFKNNIQTNAVPSKEACLEFIKKYGVNRQWSTIKGCVCNHLHRLSKLEHKDI